MSLAINFAEKKDTPEKKTKQTFCRKKNNCAFYFYALLL